MVAANARSRMPPDTFEEGRSLQCCLVVIRLTTSGAGGDGDFSGRGGGPGGRVTVDDAFPARVVLRASFPRPGLVVLNDAWALGWRVRVDGREAGEVRVNETMRGVVVGAGVHEVEWRYRVPGLRVGAMLALVAVVVTLGLGLSAARFRTRRRTKQSLML